MKTQDVTSVLELLHLQLAAGIGLFLILALSVRLAKRLRKTKAQKRHAWNQKRSVKDIARIKEIGPRLNPGQCFSWLRKMDPYRFEEMILTALQQRGLKIVRNASYSGDGGVDGQFYLNDELWLVQAKRYTGAVKTAHIWDFEAICARRGCRGLFIHTGKTPEGVKALGRQAGCTRIISGSELMSFFAGETLKLKFKAPAAVDPIDAARPDLPVPKYPHSTRHGAMEGAA